MTNGESEPESDPDFEPAIETVHVRFVARSALTALATTIYVATLVTMNYLAKLENMILVAEMAKTVSTVALTY